MEGRLRETSPSLVLSLKTLAVSLEGWERPGGMMKTLLFLFAKVDRKANVRSVST